MARNQSTVYVGNLSEKVTEDLLYELFIQAGPVANVNIPSDRGRSKLFGFVQFKHPCSVLYAIQLFEGISLFGKTLRLNLPKGSVLPGMPMGLPPMPPMGLPPMPRMDLQPQPFIHPLSLHGRLGPPPKPPKSHGRLENDDDDPRDRQRSRRRDDMMPSSRHAKNRKGKEAEIDLDAIPDFLDPFGSPIPSQGPPKPSQGHGRRREHPYEDTGSYRSHHDSRRDHHSHRPFNNRRRF